MLKLKSVPTPFTSLPLLRQAAALSYTAFMLLVLLQSSGQPIIGQPAPPGPPDLAREILLTLGHVAGFALLTLLWWRALRDVSMPAHGLRTALVIAFALGLLTEGLQTLVPDRGASVTDLAANWLAALAAAWWIRRR